MAFKITLASDVRGFMKGAKSVEDELEKVADSLDTLATDTKADAGKAADALSREFRDAFSEVRANAKRAGSSVGDELKDGTRKATEATGEMRQAAHQNAREVAASFDGSAQSLVDGFQGAAAEMFDGFGPAGAAAGLAVAAGMGLASAALTQADEDAKAAREATLELGKALATASTRARGFADATADAMSEAVKNPQNVADAMFGKDGTDRLTLYSDTIRNAGLNYGDVLAAMQGDDEAYARVTQQAWARTDEAHEQSTISFLDDLNKRNQASKDAQKWADEYANSQVAAQQKAAEAAENFSATLTDNLSVADDGLDKFTKKGKLHLDAWTKELKRRAKENAEVKEFSVDIAPQLSPQAMENIANLPTETQAQIAKAYKDGSKKDRKKIVTNLELEATTDNVKIDTSGAQATANKNPVEVPTVVVSTGMPKSVRDAADDGQKEADKDANVIEFKTKIDKDDLQRQVNKAAAEITAPTIYVKVKPKKETP